MRSLRALILEDSADDCELVLLELKRGGYDVAWERVATAQEMLGSLDRGPWDLVLSDFQMPGFGALDALRLYKEKGLDLPFIIVSGTIDEEEAVEAFKAGAHDFVTKQKLARLCAAVA